MNQTKHRISLGAMLNWPAPFLSRIAWRYGRVNRYETEGQSIIQWQGIFLKQVIEAQQIKSWSVHGEMGFDVVYITFVDSLPVTWIDKYGDLLEALRKLVPLKEQVSGN